MNGQPAPSVQDQSASLRSRGETPTPQQFRSYPTEDENMRRLRLLEILAEGDHHSWVVLNRFNELHKALFPDLCLLLPR
jgi:hypothetical protein